MFKPINAFKCFSVDDLTTAKKFYAETLGLQVKDEGVLGLRIHLPGGATAYAYSKENHQPATYTMLDLVVENIAEAVESLKRQGVHFEKYATMQQDEKGIFRGLGQSMGPDIAWFKDPAGNILAVVQLS